MNCQEIIEELEILAENKRTKSSNEAIVEAIEIINDWAFAHGRPEDQKPEDQKKEG